MADRIQGLSIGLGMDSAEVSRSMSEIKRSFRGLSSQAKVTSNNFKYGAKDVSTYKSNLSALSDTVDKQSQNVEDLGKRYSTVVEEQGASSKAAQSLATEYNKQADSLNRLKDQLKIAEEGLRDVYNESSRLSKIGDTFGGISNSLKNVSGSLQNVGSQIKDVGGSLTRNITLPASAAALAVGGITAKFGWDRLVGLDSAQAQLKGLGYSTEEVGRISDQVTSAIDGGMTTMAEGTSVAAGALAAGVAEGAELEKYIKLVGDAAVGANRPVNEMATIFNRVQGTGQLMTGELNQVEDALPGFSQSMADHLGVSYEKMREMVTAGDVTSSDFITVMDGFAGDMAAAYTDSWAGMVANTKAYVGILGENLLSGVFEKSKESIAEFVEFLKSPEVVEWAKTTGSAIGETFSEIVTKVQAGITWFKNLDTEQQKLIGKLGLVAVAAGPLLTVFGAVTIFVGKVVGVFSSLFGGLSTLFGWFGKLSGGIKMIVKEGKSFAQVFPKLSKVISPIISIFSRLGGIAMKVIRPAFTAIRIALVALTGPVGIAVGIITALGAGFMIAYKKSETFRNFINGIGSKIKDAFQWVMDFKDGILGLFKDEGDSGIDILTSIGLSDGMVQRLWDISGKFMEFYHKIKGGITGIIDMFKGDWMGGRSILERVGFTPDQILSIENFVISIQFKFHQMKEGIKTALSAVSGFFFSIFNGIRAWWDANGPAIIGAVSDTIERFRKFNAAVWNGVKTAFITVFNFIRNWWASNGQTILGTIVAGFQWLKDTAGLVINLIVAVIRRAFTIGQALFSTFSTVVSTIWKTLWNVLVEAVRIFAPIVQGIWNTLWSVIKNTIQIFAPIISGIVKTAINIITETFRIFKPIVLGIWNTLWPVVVNVIQGAWSRMKLIVGIGMDLIQGIIKTATALINGNWSVAWEAIRQTVSSIKDRIVTHITGMKDRAIALIQQLAGGAIQWFQSMWQRTTNTVLKMKLRVELLFTSLRSVLINTVNNLVNRVVSWFQNMRTGLQNISNATRSFLTSLWNNLRDRVVNTASNLWARVRNTFNNLKNGTRNIFNSVRTFLTNLWNNTRDRVSNTVTNLRDRMVRGFTRIYNAIKSKVTSARDIAIRLFNNLRDRAASIVSGLRDRIFNLFTRISNSIRDKMRSAKDWAIDAAQSMWTGVTDFFSDIWSDATDLFDNMVDAAKELPSRIGDAISGAASFAVDGVKSMGNKMGEKLGGVVNGVTGGLNDVLGKIGVDDLIPEISIPTFSTGTSGGAIANNMLGILNDKGPGNGSGGATQELIERNGSLLAPQGKNAMVPLEKGDRIYNGAETQSLMSSGLIPHFSKGTGKKGKGETNEKKGLLGTIGDVLKNTWDYIKNPGKAFQAVIDNVGVDFSGLSGFGSKMAKGGFGLIKDKALGWLKGIFKDNEGGQVSGGSILNRAITASFGRYPANIARQLGISKHYGLDTAHRYEPLKSPISGKVDKVWNDYGGGNSIQIRSGDLTWWFMHMQSIAKKVGDAVKVGSLLGTTGNTGNNTTGYHLHTQAMKGGVGNRFAIDPEPILKNNGFATGGFVNNGLYRLGEEGHGEWIIPTDPRRATEAMKLLALAGKDVQGNKRPGQLPNVGGSGSNETVEAIMQLLDATLEQNKTLKAILQKDNNVYMDGEKMNKRMNEIDAVNTSIEF